MQHQSVLHSATVPGDITTTVHRGSGAGPMSGLLLLAVDGPVLQTCWQHRHLIRLSLPFESARPTTSSAEKLPMSLNHCIEFEFPAGISLYIYKLIRSLSIKHEKLGNVWSIYSWSRVVPDCEILWAENIYLSGSTTELLTSCFFCLHSAALLMMNEEQFYLGFFQILTIQRGGYPYSSTSLYGECSLKSLNGLVIFWTAQSQNRSFLIEQAKRKQIRLPSYALILLMSSRIDPTNFKSGLL